MNVLCLSGHIGSDAETRFSNNGTGITTFSVPVETGWGENKTTTWVKCTLFGKKGAGDTHGLAPYLTKGRFVCVTGEMSLSQWESAGKSHAQVQCVVRDVSLGPEKAEAPARTEAQARTEHPRETVRQENNFPDDDIPF